MAEKISQIRVSGTDYDLAKTYKTANVTSLENLDVTNDLIYAKLSGPTIFSLNGTMEVGQKLTLIIEPTADFVQNFKAENIMNDFKNSKWFKANQIDKFIISCYENGKYYINTFGENYPTYYILVSASSDGSVNLLKYTNPNGSSTETITIPANSTDYKVDGLIYGFQTSGGRYITSLDVSNFDTSKVTSMYNMFNYCSSLTSLDLSNFDTSKVTSMSGMFNSCSSLTSLDLSNFDTSKATDTGYMFGGCLSLTSLDLSNFDTSNVTNMNGMFSNCSKLNSIKCKQAFKDWCWTNQDNIGLPSAMRSGGSGQWEIVS